ncbi:MAG: tRNA glutamyl-Q(34) synthetase GluQRS [Emcibacter sp.]|nr:tRNA glutamyl-Q(34) synthetase GluQRS [Emcibacter sp.]
MTPPEPIITRFAPSPTGYLHLGHAYSAKLAHDFAVNNGGKFLLRIEDIDQTRCKPEFETAIYDDLHWLGIKWELPVRRQSDHGRDYQNALNVLQKKDLLYPCFCTRKDIQQEIIQSGYAPHHLGLDHESEPPYPKICANLSEPEKEAKYEAGTVYALRLNMDKALDILGSEKLIWSDLVAGEQWASSEILRDVIGDVVLARKDIQTSYHLSVVVDDHLQNISHVIRGADLFYASHLHRLLQFLLGYRTPIYHHHKLLTDENGNRYAKRDKSLTLHHLRKQGQDPKNIL